MNAKILFVLAVALCAVQAQSFSQAEKHIAAYRQQLAEAVKEFEQLRQDALAQGQDQLRLSLEEIIEKIKELLGKAKEVTVAGIKCVNEHKEELLQLTQVVSHELELCVTEHSGPVIEAVQQFNKDLAAAAAVVQQLHAAGKDCGFNLECWRPIITEAAPQLQEVGKTLANDLYAVHKAIWAVLPDINECVRASLAAHQEEGKKILQEVAQCIAGEIGGGATA